MSVASKRALEYLEGQPGIIFNRLYKQPSTALAIFRRMLPHLGELYPSHHSSSRLTDHSQESGHGYALHAYAICRLRL
jgi:hypothetical protein